MVSETTRKRLPPYISYRSFSHFIIWLREGGIPARIDRSFWGQRFSGSNGQQLIAALRFLGLIDSSNIPSPRLRELVSARDNHRGDVLRQICTDAYLFLLGSTFEPQLATYAQLQELFHSVYQLTDDVARKCIKFFTELAQEAGIPLSPFITKKPKKIRSAAGTKKSFRKLVIGTSQNLKIPPTAEEIPQQKTWVEMLLTKFPAFDPGWTDEVKLKWFEGFGELLKMRLSSENGRANPQ